MQVIEVARPYHKKRTREKMSYCSSLAESARPTEDVRSPLLKPPCLARSQSLASRKSALVSRRGAIVFSALGEGASVGRVHFRKALARPHISTNHPARHLTTFPLRESRSLGKRSNPCSDVVSREHIFAILDLITLWEHRRPLRCSLRCTFRTDGLQT